jgi:hypothetical protein
MCPVKNVAGHNIHTYTHKETERYARKLLGDCLNGWISGEKVISEGVRERQREIMRVVHNAVCITNLALTL